MGHGTDNDDLGLRAAELDEAWGETTSSPRAVYDDVPSVSEGWEIGADETRPDWSVLEQIAWALRKGSEHEATADELAYVAGKEREAVMAGVQPRLDDIDSWLADATSGEVRSMEWFRERLERWAYTNRLTHLEEPNNVKLPAGSVSTIYKSPKIVVVDAEMFVGWYLMNVVMQEPPSGDDVLSWTPKIGVNPLRKMKGLKIGVEEVVDDEGEIFKEPCVFYSEEGDGKMVRVPGLGVSEGEILPKVSWV